MRCLDADAIDRYARGALDVTERAEVIAHIAECARCGPRVLALAGRGDDPAVTTLAATAGMVPNAPSAPTLLEGVTLGRYRIEGVIGAGGMGVVYRAFDPKLGRAIALKVVRPVDDDSAADARTRLIREARAMAKIAHPNVIAVHDAGDVDDDVFIAMELVAGHSLADWEKQRPHPWREIIGFYVQAAQGLAAAHRVGLVHRDFKPHNVLVGHDGRVRVLDFGIARSSDETDAPRTNRATSSSVSQVALTETGAILGSPMYMSPEQHEGQQADARSDQFSFCVALYHALYGALPYPGTSYFELRHTVTTGEATPPPRGSPVPPAIGRALLRGLARERGARFSSIDELIALLADAARPRRRRWLLAASAALVAALTATAIVLAMRPRAVVSVEESGFDAHQQPVTFADSDAPTLSPDGRRLAYSSVAGIVVRDLATGSSKVVRAGGANDLRWSPVGDRLLIATRTGPKIITADGELVRDVPLFGTLCRTAWSPDATRVLWHCLTDEAFTVINVASGATRTVVLPMPGIEKVVDLDWSFRGEIALTALAKSRHGEVWVADIDKVTAERLAAEMKVVLDVRWNARGTRVYYSQLKPDGGGEIVYRERSAPGISEVALPLPSLSLSSQASFAISPDERALFYTLQGDHADVVKVSAAGARSFVTTDAQLKVALSVSPDGAEIAYAAGPVSAQRMYRQRFDGQPRPIDIPVSAYGLSCYSPRGDQLAVKGSSNITIVTLASGEVRHLPDHASDVLALGWTPEGLVYQVGTGALLVVDPDTGQSVTRDLGGAKPTLTAFSRDGARVAGLDAGGNMVLVDVRDGSSRVIASSGFRPFDFSTDGAWIYAARDGRVVAVSLQGDNVQRLLGLGSNASESRVLPDESVVQIAAQGRQVIWLASRDPRATLVPEPVSPTPADAP